MEISNTNENEVVQLDSHRFLISAPTLTHLMIKCETFIDEQSRLVKFTGMRIVTMPNGCSGTMNGFQFFTIGNLGSYHSFIAQPSTLDFNNTLAGMNIDGFHRMVNDLMFHNVSTIDLGRLKTQIVYGENYLHPYNHTIFYVVLALITMASIAITFTCRRLLLSKCQGRFICPRHLRRLCCNLEECCESEETNETTNNENVTPPPATSSQ